MKKRYISTAMIILISFAFIMPSFAGKANDIRYGGQYYPGEFVLQGYPQLWEKYGVKVEHILFSSGSENNQALISGRSDINCGSDSKTVALFNVIGEEALIIGTIQKGDRYATVVRQSSPYRNWSELKGKTVGTRLGSGAEQVLRRYFDTEDNLAWEDFRWVNLKLEDMISALKGNAIEAFTVWEPTSSIAEAQGIGRVIRTYGDISLVPVSIHTTRKFARENRDLVVRFLAAHLAKAELIKNDPEKAAEIAANAASARGYSVSAEAFKKVFKRIDFSIEVNDDIISSIQNTAQFLYQKKKIKQIPTFSFDPTFLEEARKIKIQ